jgi:hypothetical protein
LRQSRGGEMDVSVNQAGQKCAAFKVDDLVISRNVDLAEFLNLPDSLVNNRYRDAIPRPSARAINQACVSQDQHPSLRV